MFFLFLKKKNCSMINALKLPQQGNLNEKPRIHVFKEKVENISTKSIMKTCLFKYIENITTKNWKFSDKNSDVFHISAQKIDSGYLLELPHWGSSNKYPQSMFFEQK